MVEILLIICIAIIVSNTLAERFKLVGPLVLIAVGVLISFIPHLPPIGVEPEIVLSVFLPLLLYWESQNISKRGMKRALRGIILNGTLMVIFVAVFIGLMGSLVGLTLGTALLIGAAVGPTDATAVASLGKGISPRQMLILRSESLINDGTALVVFSLALEYASTSDDISPLNALGKFVLSFGGGVVVGLAVGWVIARIGRYIESHMIANVFRFAVPFLSYFLAEEIGGSGVLAVVVTGLYMSQVGPKFITTRSRVLARPVWGFISYFLNALLFLLVGLHLPNTVRELSNDTLTHASIATVVLFIVMVLARWLFSEIAIRIIRLLDRSPAQKLRRTTPQGRIVNTLAGFRGAISLAVAFSIPETLADGSPFPYRDVILFVTTGIVILSLVVQGALLPAAVRWSAAHPAPEEQDGKEEAEELQKAYAQVYRTVEQKIPEIAQEVGASADSENRIFVEWQHSFSHNAADPDEVKEAVADLAAENEMRLRIIRLGRQTAIKMRDDQQIDDEALNFIMDRYDLEEMRITGPLELE